MTYIIGKGSIESRIKNEQDQRKQERRFEDIGKGLTKSSQPQRGDYEMCRKLDPVLKDYRNYKNPKDREKIRAEYFGRQTEYRKG